MTFPRRNKYGNKKVSYRGEAFDSILERDRFIFLEHKETQELISDLKRQVRYKLFAYDTHICDYIADFTYCMGNDFFVEDAKGIQTPEFKLKKKLFEAQTKTKINLIGKKTLAMPPGEPADER